jgi:transcriptional regulator with XRE-family HTH domain
VWPISNLEVERRRAGMTIKKLADKMGISGSLVSQIENGVRKPYPKFRRQASEILGVPEELLFDDIRRGA